MWPSSLSKWNVRVTDKQEKQGDQGREFYICVGPMPALHYIPYLNLG